MLMFLVIIIAITTTAIIIFAFQSSQPQPDLTSTQAKPQNSPQTQTKPLDQDRYFLKNVIAENLRECSTDLAGLEQYPAIQNLSVPRSLCIQYTPQDPYLYDPLAVVAAGRYSAGTVGIYTQDFNLTIQTKRRSLLHELCHANQDYYIRFKASPSYWELTPYDWSKTPAGQEFINITGYNRVDDDWVLSSNSPYLGIYYGTKRVLPNSQVVVQNPMELAAEVCAMFLLPEGYKDKYTQAQMDSVLSDQELHTWFNKYVSGVSMLPTQDIYTIYYSDGAVKEKRFYRADQTIERREVYRPDGTLQNREHYKIGSNKPIMRETYWLDNTLLSRQTYRLSTGEKWTLEQSEHYKDGKLELRIYYNPDGTIERKES